MIILNIFIILILLITILKSYTNYKYNNIDKELRINGIISNIIIRFKDEKSLINLSKLYSKKIGRVNKKFNLKTEYINGYKSKIKILILSDNKKKENRTCLIWLHGGGFAMKKPEDELKIMEKFVNKNSSVVISPTYTLSINSPYPTALLDCYNTLKWAHYNADKLGINKNQIFVGGGSAGGGLTASLSLLARDKDEVKIAFQMPLYPMINYNNITNNSKTLIWDTNKNKIAWNLYLKKTKDKYSDAINSNDFKNLPPTYTFVGTEDPFYEDTLNYIKKLKKEKNKVKYKIYKNAYHAFEIICPNAKLSKRALNDLLIEYEYASLNYYTEEK